MKTAVDLSNGKTVQDNKSNQKKEKNPEKRKRAENTADSIPGQVPKKTLKKASSAQVTVNEQALLSSMTQAKTEVTIASDQNSGGGGKDSSAGTYVRRRVPVETQTQPESNYTKFSSYNLYIVMSYLDPKERKNYMQTSKKHLMVAEDFSVMIISELRMTLKNMNLDLDGDWAEISGLVDDRKFDDPQLKEKRRAFENFLADCNQHEFDYLYEKGVLDIVKVHFESLEQEQKNWYCPLLTYTERLTKKRDVLAIEPLENLVSTMADCDLYERIGDDEKIIRLIDCCIDLHSYTNDKSNPRKNMAVIIKHLGTCVADSHIEEFFNNNIKMDLPNGLFTKIEEYLQLLDKDDALVAGFTKVKDKYRLNDVYYQFQCLVEQNQ